MRRAVERIERRAGTDERPILRLAGHAGREAAEALRGAPLGDPRRARARAGAGRVLGARARGLRGLGRRRGTWARCGGCCRCPSCEALEVARDGGGELLVPMVRDAIRSVDVERAAHRRGLSRSWGSERGSPPGVMEESGAARSPSCPIMNVTRIPRRTVVPFLAAGALLTVPAAARRRVRGRRPYTTGNPSCLDLGYAHELKFDPPSAGSKAATASPSTCRSAPTQYGKLVDWTSSAPIDAVIVKGGPNANAYVYAGRVVGRHRPAHAVQRPRQVLRPEPRQLLLGRRDAPPADEPPTPRTAAGRGAARRAAARRAAAAPVARRPRPATCSGAEVVSGALAPARPVRLRRPDGEGDGPRPPRSRRWTFLARRQAR